MAGSSAYTDENGRFVLKCDGTIDGAVVGKHLAKLAADNMIRTTMELGGHGPVLVFSDADVDKALETCVAGKYRNAGQFCVSPTRFIVEENVFEKFRDGFIAGAGKVVVGNGLDAGTTMGPMANPRRPEAMDRLIGNAVAKGARLGAGGQKIGNQGFFYAPSVISEVPLDADIMHEEPFGPVAIINPFKDEDAMIAEANRLPYGLAAYAWAGDVQRQRRLAVDAGQRLAHVIVPGGGDGLRFESRLSEPGGERTVPTSSDESVKRRPAKAGAELGQRPRGRLSRGHPWANA